MPHALSYASPAAPLVLVSDGRSLSGVWVRGQKYFPDTLPEETPGLAALENAREWLERYFAGERPGIAELPLKPSGTPFRLRVWDELKKIPYGETVSYGELAKRLGTSPRAVGGAVGRNPISIIIPCHRVIGADGSLTGYAGGLDLKTKLLRAEGIL